jgi:hypothetical protein
MELAAEKEFYLAAACEEVYVPPSAYISLKGVAVSGTFLRGVLEKVGVEPQIQRIGKFKSAGDQLGRKDMSDAQREVLQVSSALVRNTQCTGSRLLVQAMSAPVWLGIVDFSV